MIELFIFIVGLIIICSVLLKEHNKKSKNAIKNWAQMNNIEIITLKYCFFRVTPFTFTKNSGVYHLKTKSADNHIENYWIGLGVGFLGFREPYKITVVHESDFKNIFSWPHIGSQLLYLVVIILFILSVISTILKKV